NSFGDPDGTPPVSLRGSVGSRDLQPAPRDSRGEPLIPGPTSSKQDPWDKVKEAFFLIKEIGVQVSYWALGFPFSITDLRSWKDIAGVYREDPERVAKVETIIRTQDPDWSDLQVILDTLLDDTEKKMVLSTAKKQVEGAHANGDLQGSVEQNFPSTNPERDPNLPGPKGMLTRYQRWILFGIRHGMPKALNWSKIYEIRQEPN
uniref:Core shell protein Gag P30 domain-containing protein n=1 Tax=Amazona collaria TaxID=241587 RepID=A0A8B9G5X8_9PSIT